jgi:hypothetical protein
VELGLYQSYGDSASGNSLFLLILNYTYSANVKVDFGRRFEGSEPGVNLFVSIHGTDCSINEQSPFSPRWYSHKLNGPGLRYDIGLNIATGDVVWAYGGYPCGSYSNLKLARNFMFTQSKM